MKTLISVTNKQGMHWINRFKPWDLSQPPLHSDHKENKEFDTVVLKNLYRICNMKRSSTHKITFFFTNTRSLIKLCSNWCSSLTFKVLYSLGDSWSLSELHFDRQGDFFAALSTWLIINNCQNNIHNYMNLKYIPI